MPAILSALRAAEIDSTSGQAASGGIAAGLASLIAYGVADSVLTRALLVGGLTLVFALALGLAYNTVVDSDG